MRTDCVIGSRSRTWPIIRLWGGSRASGMRSCRRPSPPTITNRGAEFVARHAVRRLDLPDDAFPVSVKVLFQVRSSPPPGTVSDPMSPTHPYILGQFQFAERAEVQP